MVLGIEDASSSMSVHRLNMLLGFCGGGVVCGFAGGGEGGGGGGGWGGVGGGGGGGGKEYIKHSLVRSNQRLLT